VCGSGGGGGGKGGPCLLGIRRERRPTLRDHQHEQKDQNHAVPPMSPLRIGEKGGGVDLTKVKGDRERQTGREKRKGTVPNVHGDVCTRRR